MKSLLVPVDQGNHMRAVFTTAAHVTGKFGGHADCVASRPGFAEIVAPDPIVAVTVPPPNWDEAAQTRRARGQFDAFCHDTNVAANSFQWRGGPSVEDGTLGSLARVYDLTVLARPGVGGSRMTAFEAVLFDSGRPVLMAPPRALATLGETIAVHWNRSAETARALAMSIALLSRAKRVVLISVEGNQVPGPQARDAAAYLAAYNLSVTERVVPVTTGPGEAILAECGSQGVDLLIKGAYTQSRFRQMFFGGATSHILAHAEIPVLLAH